MHKRARAPTKLLMLHFNVDLGGWGALECGRDGPGHFTKIPYRKLGLASRPVIFLYNYPIESQSVFE